MFLFAGSFPIKFRQEKKLIFLALSFQSVLFKMGCGISTILAKNNGKNLIYFFDFLAPQAKKKYQITYCEL